MIHVVHRYVCGSIMCAHVCSTVTVQDIVIKTSLHVSIGTRNQLCTYAHMCVCVCVHTRACVHGLASEIVCFVQVFVYIITPSLPGFMDHDPSRSQSSLRQTKTAIADLPTRRTHPLLIP